MYFRLGDYYHLSEYYYEQMGGGRKHNGVYGGDCYCGVFKLGDIQATAVEIGGTLPLDVAAKGNLTIKEIKIVFCCKACRTEIQVHARSEGFEYLSAIQILKIKDPWYQMFIPLGGSSKETNPNLLFKMKKG